LQAPTSLPNGQKQELSSAAMSLKAKLLKATCQSLNSHNKNLERQCIIQELAVALEAAQPKISDIEARYHAPTKPHCIDAKSSLLAEPPK
jgi:HPt (histidine-containing phosphotransfer) domain-containing protein